MKGFDRPVKPEWIYKIIQELEIGDFIYKKRDRLDEFLVELDGKTGKRKVITVIGRYFLKAIDNPRGQKVEDNLIFKMIKDEDYETVIPLMLFNLLVKAPVLQKFSEQILNYYGEKKEIDSDFLRKKAYQQIGERDIARRSLRNFLSTLVDFDVLEQKDRTTFSWNEKLKVNEENAVGFIQLYSRYYLDSPQVSLLDIPDSLLFYFEMPDLQELAKKYNNEYWQYVRRVNAALVTLKNGE